MNTLGLPEVGNKGGATREGIPTRPLLVNLSAGHVLLIYAPRRRKPELWIVLDEGAGSGGTSASAHQAIRLSPSSPPSISQVCITSRSGAEGGEVWRGAVCVSRKPHLSASSGRVTQPIRRYSFTQGTDIKRGDAGLGSPK